jgi:mannose-6-phosphate isomerase-like protein (cupin superfamily)
LPQPSRAAAAGTRSDHRARHQRPDRRRLVRRRDPHATRRRPAVLHRHAPGEIYYVTDGEFTFYVADGDVTVRRVTARAGDVVPLAGGTPHTIRNESVADAVAFVVHAPGAPMENFSRAVAALAAGGSPSMDAVLTIAAQHGIELLGPVPAATAA